MLSMLGWTSEPSVNPWRTITAPGSFPPNARKQMNAKAQTRFSKLLSLCLLKLPIHCHLHFKALIQDHHILFLSTQSFGHIRNTCTLHILKQFLSKQSPIERTTSHGFMRHPKHVFMLCYTSNNWYWKKTPPSSKSTLPFHPKFAIVIHLKAFETVCSRYALVLSSSYDTLKLFFVNWTILWAPV